MWPVAPNSKPRETAPETKRGDQKTLPAWWRADHHLGGHDRGHGQVSRRGHPMEGDVVKGAPEGSEKEINWGP